LKALPEAEMGNFIVKDNESGEPGSKGGTYS